MPDPCPDQTKLRLKASETKLRHEDAHRWARHCATRVDQGLAPDRSSVSRLHTFGDLNDLRVAEMRAIGKPPHREPKRQPFQPRKRDHGKEKISHLDRHKFILHGRKRADQGAGPVTPGIDIAVIQMIMTRAAAVRDLEITSEPVDPARVALSAPRADPQGRKAGPWVRTSRSGAPIFFDGLPARPWTSTAT